MGRVDGDAVTVESKSEQSVAPVRATSSRAKWLGAALGVAAIATAAVVVARQRAATDAKLPVERAALTVPRILGDAVEFPPAMLKAFGVTTEAAERRNLTEHLSLIGRAAFDPEHVAAVGTRTKGLIHEVKKFEGDHVRAGEVLAVVESTELANVQAVLESTAAKVDAARANADRERKLLAGNLTTAREAEQAKAELAAARAEQAAAAQHVKALLRGANGRKLGEYELHAPIDGVIVHREIALGQSVDNHVLAFRVADLRHLWIELAATDKQLRSMHVGDPVDIAPVTAPDSKLQGKIAYIGDVLDPLTGTAPVRVEVTCQERQLRPGQAVRAVVAAASREREALTVPREAVTSIDGRTVVFVQETATRLRMAAVEVGDDDGRWQEIRSGVKAGQRVVVGGVFAVKSELYR